MPRKKRIDPIPEEFASYEEAAEFWDTHDPEDYPDAFRPVKATVKLRRQCYEIEIDEDLMQLLRATARRQKKTVDKLVSELLRKQLAAK